MLNRVIAMSLVALAVSASKAQAFFKVCNQTGEHVFVAFGYPEGENWIAEGWWEIANGSCENLIDEALSSRYYFIRAEGKNGGIWEGESLFCTTDGKFTLVDSDDCVSSKINRQRFFQVDTGDSRYWTINFKP